MKTIPSELHAIGDFDDLGARLQNFVPKQIGHLEEPLDFDVVASVRTAKAWQG
ncbi:MAG: hypothetical protein WC889_05795 [Myxococcota bacterium]|jgi:hypothetical protein